MMMRNFCCDMSRGPFLQFGDPNADIITRDPYTHFNFARTPQDAKHFVMDGGYNTTTTGRGRVHEDILIHQLGDYVYNEASHSGKDV